MERPIVEHLFSLAQNPRNRQQIVQDQGCLPGLVLFLDSDDAETTELAVKTMSLLADCEANRSIMWNELGLVLSLNKILDKEDASEATKTLAKEVMRKVTPGRAPAAAAELATPQSKRMRQPLKTVQTPTHSIFRNNINKNARTITLQIKGLDDLAARRTVETQLLQVKGVVSFTFDMKKARVIVRAKMDVAPEKLCAAIDQIKTMRATQVVRDANGQEVELSFGAAPAGARQRQPPAYLDEDDEENEDATLTKQALARVGEASSKVGGWINSVSGYLSKSLYW